MNFTNKPKILFVVFAVFAMHPFIMEGQVTQPGYTKVLQHTSTTHTQGRSILDQNGIRVGGFTNAVPDIPSGEQISHVRDFYKFWPNNGSGLVSSVTIQEIFQGSASIECNAYVTNFPHPSSTDSYTGVLSCSTLINPPYNGFLSTNILHENSAGPDYNLTILDANIDLQVNSSKVIGTPWLENNGYCDNCPDKCLSPSSVNGYFLGSTRMPVLGGPSKLYVNHLDNDHTVLWAKEIGLSNSPKALLQETMLFGSIGGGVLVNYRNGWLPGGLIQLDNFGVPQWGQQYQLTQTPPNSPKVDAHIRDIYQDMSDPLSPILLATYAIPGAGNALDVPMAVLEISPQLGSPQTTAMFSYAGYRLFPIRLQKAVDGSIILVGQIIQANTTGQSDILVVKLDPTYALTWAKSYHLGEYSFANDFSLASDGSFLVSGVTSIEHPGSPNNYDYFLMRLGPNGAVTQGHYYKTDASDEAVALLTPVTGDHIIDGYYRSPVSGSSAAVSHARLFVKSDPTGVALYCNSIPFDITGTNLALVSGGTSSNSKTPANLISSTTLTPVSQNVLVVEQPSGCEDCHCE